MEQVPKTTLQVLYELEAKDAVEIGGLELSVLATSYSKMKYGDKNEINQFTIGLIEKFKSNFLNPKGRVFLTSTLVTDVESSSHLIAKALVSEINVFRYEAGLTSIKYIELLAVKDRLLSEDYGKVSSTEARIKSQGNLSLISYPKLRAEDALIIVSDAYVTGAQWSYQEKLLRDVGLDCTINAYFIIKFLNLGQAAGANIEDKYNNYCFPNDLDVVNFIVNNSLENNFAWNKRTILRCLEMNDDDFKQLITSLKKNVLKEFIELSILADAHLVNGGKYVEHLSVACNQL